MGQGLSLQQYTSSTVLGQSMQTSLQMCRLQSQFCHIEATLERQVQTKSSPGLVLRRQDWALIEGILESADGT